MKISKSAGAMLKPHAPKLIPALLESLSVLEPQVLNYLSLRATEQEKVSRQHRHLVGMKEEPRSGPGVRPNRPSIVLRQTARLNDAFPAFETAQLLCHLECSCAGAGGERAHTLFCESNGNDTSTQTLC